MSIHFKDKCFIVNGIACTVPCFTKHNKQQPHIVMQGFAKDIIISNNEATIV